MTVTGTCIYCGKAVDHDDPVRCDDSKTWKTLAAQHTSECPWASTRGFLLPTKAVIDDAILSVKPMTEKVSDRLREHCEKAVKIASDLVEKKGRYNAQWALLLADDIWGKAWELEDLRGLAVASALYLAVYRKNQMHFEDWAGLVREIREYQSTQTLVEQTMERAKN